MPFLAAAIPLIGTAIASASTAVAIGAETAALALGVSAGTAFAVADIALAVVPAVIEFGALAGVSALLSPKPQVNTAGSPQAFKADPQAPVPFVMGRYGVAGNLVYETTTGGASKAEHGAAGNEFLTQFVVLSGGGPIEGFESLLLDNTVLTFNGEACTGGNIESDYVQTYNPGYTQNSNGTYANNNYTDHIWQYTQTGAPGAGGMGYPAKINNSNDYIPEWTSAFGLSYLAAAAITRSYDTTVWTGGVGQPQWTIKGYKLYDPRLDSSQPGGVGPQRWPGSAGDRRDYYPAARGTWAWSENPIIHALNYALGHYLADPSTGSSPADINCGRLYAGCGAGFAGVDVAAFVRAANNADANGWKVCGQWTTGDGKRSVLTAMLQAGGAQLVSDRGRISCTFSAPVTAVNAGAPLGWNDLAGAPSLDTTIGTRDRANTAFYSYSSEAHRWQVVQADTPVVAGTYVAEDAGIVRSKKLTFEYVPSVDQAAQLAAYAIVDGRELPNIVLPGKPHLRGYGVGDCILVDLPELGLHLAKLVVLKRSTDPSTAIVTITCRSETDAKHAYALGRSGVAPATPSISGYDPAIVPAPIPASWAADAVAINDPVTGEIVHVVRINGSTIDNVYAAQVVVSYRQVIVVGGADTEPGDTASQTFAASQEQIDLNLPAGRWHVWLRYVTINGAEDVDNALDLGVITVNGTTSASTNSVPGGALIGSAQETVDQVLARIKANAPDTTAPAVPSGLTATSTLLSDGLAQVVLGWAANTDSDLAGYQLAIVQGAGSNIGANGVLYPAPKNGYQLTLPAATQFTFEVRAVDVAGNLSGWSSTFTFVSTRDTTPPAAPSAPSAAASISSIFLAWTNDTATDLAGVEVWTGSANSSAQSTRLSTVNAEPGAPGGFTHAGLYTGATRYYWLKSFDTSGNVSGFSAGVSAAPAAVNTADIAPQAVKIAQIAQGIAPPLIVNTPNINDGSVVADRSGGLAYNTYNGKMYRNAGGAGAATSWAELIYSAGQISGQLADTQIAAIAAAKLTGSITSTQITDGAISTPKLAAGAVTTAALAAGSVTSDTLAANSVTAGKIVAGGVTTAALAAGAVTADTLAAGAITAGKVAAGAIGATQIAARAITAAKLAVVAPNLFADPNFTDPTYWSTPTQSASGAVLPGPNGANIGWSFESNPSATNTPGYIILRASGNATLYGPQVTITPGASYELSCIGTNSSNQGATYEFRFLKADGTQVGTSGALGVPAGDTSSAPRRTQCTAPANAVYACPIFYCNGVTSGQALFAQADAREAAAGTFIVDGTITGTKVAAGTLTANNIAAGTITADKVQAGTLTGDRFSTSTSLPGSITVGTTGVSIATLQAQAANPGEQVNASSTLIAPGKIQLTGATTLTSWMNGGDNTKIEGGAIAANTVAANKVTIGVRGITVYSGSFTCQPGQPNTLHWTGGIIQYVADGGTYTQVTIPAQDFAYSNSPIWVWWNKGNSFGSTTDATIVGDPTVVIMATFYGNNFFIANYGGTIIDGSRITTGSITTGNLAAGAVTADKISVNRLDAISANLGSINVGNANIGQLAVGTLQLASGAVTSLFVTINTGQSTLPVISSGVSAPSTTDASGSGTSAPTGTSTGATGTGAGSGSGGGSSGGGGGGRGMQVQ